VGLADRVAELEEIAERSRSTVDQLQEELRKKDRMLDVQAERISTARRWLS
jgi:hypothetical protein